MRALWQFAGKPTARLELPTPSLRVAYLQHNYRRYAKFNGDQCSSRETELPSSGPNSGPSFPVADC
jgi:hypothetical protein